MSHMLRQTMNRNVAPTDVNRLFAILAVSWEISDRYSHARTRQKQRLYEHRTLLAPPSVDF